MTNGHARILHGRQYAGPVRRPERLRNPLVDGLLEQIVAESAASFRSLAEDKGWRRVGSKAASERTAQDLAAARADSRRLLEGSDVDDGNEFAIGAMECRVNYVHGDAFEYEAVPEPNHPESSPLLATVNDFLNAFRELNDLATIEAEALWRGDRDGEWFLRVFPAGGIPEVRFIEPERVVGLSGTQEAGEGWGVDPGGVGVWTDPADATRVLGYTVDDGTGAIEYVPESQVVHCRFNATSASRRGWPTFEPIRKALVRAEELLVAMTATGKARAKIALVEQIDGFTQDKADGIVSRLTTRTRIEESANLPPTLRSVLEEYLPYGSRIRLPKSSTLSFPNAGVGASDLVEVLQANLRAAGARLTMPEWMFSGLADAKYSNAFVVEAPTLKAFRRLQRKQVIAFGEGRLARQASVVWRALRLAVEARILPAETLAACRVQVTPPNLEIRDRNGEAARNVQYIQEGVKSRQTTQEEEGLDPDEELRRIQSEIPIFGPPGGPPAAPGGAPAPTPGQPADALAGLAATIGEALRPLADRLDRLESWTAEARDLSQLVKKVVTTKSGRKMTVYVRPREPGSLPPRRSAAGDPEEPAAAVRSALRNPGKLSAAEVAALPDQLKRLTLAELRALNLEAGRAAGRSRSDATERILGHVESNRPTDPPSNPVRDPGTPIDYQPRDPNHPVAKAIRDDADSRAVLDRFTQAVGPLAEKAARAEELDRAVSDLYTRHEAAWAAWAGAYTENASRGEKTRLAKEKTRLERELQAAQAIRGEAFAAQAELRRTARTAFVEAMGVETPATFQEDRSRLQATPAQAAAVDRARDFVGSITAGLTDTPVFWSRTDGRSWYSPHGSIIAMGREMEPGREYAVESTAAHELGHLIEMQKSGVLQRAKDFLAYRIAGEPRTRLDSLPGAVGYTPDEEGAKDRFDRVFPGNSAYYVGKRYDNATEVVSMGVEQLHRDPVAFARNDPEYFAFLVSVLRAK